MKILVTGATGTVGRQVVEQVLAIGHQVRALTRNPAKAKFPAGVEVMAGDLTNPATLIPALEGVEGVHLINFGGEYAMLETGAEIVALAEKAGVKRVTVLRGGQEGTVEQAVKASKLAWTFLQPVEFMANMLEWSPSIRAERNIRVPFGSRKTAIVHEADIAAVAAIALTEDGHAGKLYDITGGEVLTPRDLLRTISQAIGRNLELIELTAEQAREEWQAAGMPTDIIEFMLWVYGNTPVQGYTVTPVVQQVTGRPPRTFAQWATEHANDFC